MQDPSLWAKIKTYDFRLEDPANTPRGAERRASIAARLSDEENWAPRYVDTAIEEYRRFIYLSRVSSDHLTPSTIVDQVWHAHMADTADYVDGFCRRLFGEMLHHDPCSGPEQMPRYEAQYARTRAVYRREFGQDPPQDIWFYRDANKVAADARQARRATWMSILAGLAVAALCLWVFGWVIFGIFLGFVTQMIVSMALGPKIPGPVYKSSDDSGSGGCSGCGD